MPAIDTWVPPKTQRRGQPLGAAGSQFSLEEVAKRATEGRNDPLIVAWARRTIFAAGNPSDETGKARALLEGQRKKIFWVSDPVHSEHMQSARITLAVSEGGDCDDVTILLGAAMMAVGLRCYVVGHAYNKAHDIQHVLLSVHCDGKWLYAEPSVQGIELGDVARKPSWERWLEMPVASGKKVKTACDATSCSTSLAGRPPSDINYQGDFVGVGRTPPAALGSLFDVTGSGFGQDIEEARLRLDISYRDMVRAHQEASDLSQVVNVPFPDPPTGGITGFTPLDEAHYQLLVKTYAEIAPVLAQASQGLRKILFDDVTAQTAVATIAGDQIRFEIGPNNVPQIVDIATGNVLPLDLTVPPPAPGVHGPGVGAYGLAIGAGVILALGVIYLIINYHNQITERENIAAQALKGKGEIDVVREGKGTNQERIELAKIEIDRLKAEADLKSANKPSLPELPKGWSDGVKALTGLIVVGGLTYGAIKLLPLLTTPKPERLPAR